VLRRGGNRLVVMAKGGLPAGRVVVRSYDREHSLQLINAGVDYQIRETFESAVNFGAAALVELGVSEDDAARIATEIRRRDAERFELEMAGGGLRAGAGMMHTNTGPRVAPKPTPFTTPRREGQALNEETAEVIKSPDLDNRAG
ncbi:MAG: potassium transporter, partial [Pseudoxanthomonas sp.]